MAAIPVLLYRTELTRLWDAVRLFDPDRIVHNFQHMDDLFDSRRVERGDQVLEFARGSYSLPESFRYDDRSYDTEAFLDELVTTGLIIVQGDTILFERYGHGHAADGHHIAWSMSKSFVSALFGIAVDEGYIPDIMAPVTDYLPELEGSGYDGVPIKHVLQMSSGVGFNEDYGDPFSDINRMGPSMSVGSLLDFAGTLERERPPGTLNHYVSVDTQVLGSILVRVTGQDLASYTSEKLWRPLGMESDAYWLVDGTGMEWAFGGLNASLRDFARFGWLYLNRGSRDGKQIVPEAWVRASVTPDAPHLMPGIKPGSSETMGYGYQWWIPDEPDGDFMALGIYGQNIYVDPKNSLVIVKNSVDRSFQRNGFENDRIAVALYRTIAADLNAGPSSRKLGALARNPARADGFFIQMADTQFGMFAKPVVFSYFGWPWNDDSFAEETKLFEQAIAHANRLRPAFVVIGGDLINTPGHAGQAEEFKRIAAQLDPSIPLYLLAGNHDLENEPTPQSLAWYRENFGKDWYSFRHGAVYGIVLNSGILDEPGAVQGEVDAQLAWLRAELPRAQASGAAHILVFQHHSYFLSMPDEADGYYNIPRETRRLYLDLFKAHGVRAVLAGHYHRNAHGRDGALEMITTGPVGRPLGDDPSGFRIVRFSAEGLDHTYHGLDEVPSVGLGRGRLSQAPAN